MTNEVTLVDVGQGDSIFIRDKQNHTMLIDVGGVPAPQEKEQWQRKYQACNAHKTLIPYLRSRGVDTIDQLVLTHTDIDRKSTRLNSSHANISYAVFCLKKKNKTLSLSL